jgi:hypothetical protein
MNLDKNPMALESADETPTISIDGDGLFLRDVRLEAVREVPLWIMDFEVSRGMGCPLHL